MILPDSFIRRQREYFRDHPESDPDRFFQSFELESFSGVRLNRMKTGRKSIGDILPGASAWAPVPWCQDGWYADSDYSLGRDPLYHAGAYYIQEPSAMLPAEILRANPGDRVLDLCAAPGGKATRLGADLNGEGVLVANEISEERTRPLLRNIELFGIENVVITNETPDRLADRFGSFFDKILIDAPCSGEGMFRRDKNAVKSWERFGPSACEPIQREILHAAHRLLKPGGEIVYSTCTFGESEDENMMEWFLHSYPEYDVISHEISGVTPCGTKNQFMRIWPHLTNGDGHFCAHLRKHESGLQQDGIPAPARPAKYDTSTSYSTRTARDAFLSFCRTILTDTAYSRYVRLANEGFLAAGSRVHLSPLPPRMFDGIRVVKMGAYQGEVKTGKDKTIFIPSHAFALSLSPADVRSDMRISLSREDERVTRYLKGETLSLTEEEAASLAPNAFILLAVEGFSLSFAKTTGNSLKNLYPKSWRLMS